MQALSSFIHLLYIYYTFLKRTFFGWYWVLRYVSLSVLWRISFISQAWMGFLSEGMAVKSGKLNVGLREVIQAFFLIRGTHIVFYSFALRAWFLRSHCNWINEWYVLWNWWSNETVFPWRKLWLKRFHERFSLSFSCINLKD